MDPRFIHELLVQKAARNDHQMFEDTDPKKAETKRKKMQAQRRLELMTMREKRGSKR